MKDERIVGEIFRGRYYDILLERDQQYIVDKRDGDPVALVYSFPDEVPKLLDFVPSDLAWELAGGPAISPMERRTDAETLLDILAQGPESLPKSDQWLFGDVAGRREVQDDIEYYILFNNRTCKSIDTDDWVDACAWLFENF